MLNQNNSPDKEQVFKIHLALQLQPWFPSSDIKHYLGGGVEHKTIEN